MTLKKQYFPAFISIVLLAGGLILNYFEAEFFTGYFRLIWYGAAYLPVGAPLIKKASEELVNLNFANEFFLMSVATLGAFAIGEYAEAVAVVLFYEIGELLQEKAVSRARDNIRALLELRPAIATVSRNSKWVVVKPEDVEPGELLLVKPGEKVPLDGELFSEDASLNNSALTGESKPVRLKKDDPVFSGALNFDKAINVRVTRVFSDSSYMRLLKLVQKAEMRKAPTERFMRRFARYYTPVVMLLALLITFIPWVFTEAYSFSNWAYRALVFLVIACPCALYISIPLGYFGGIGAASKNGILFKGADFIDRMRNLRTLLIDKTGTLTRGVFSVQEYKSFHFDSHELLKLVTALESRSNHPVAKAILEYSGNNIPDLPVKDVEEIQAHGIKGMVDGKEVIAGNKRMIDQFNIRDESYDFSGMATPVHIAVEGKYAGYFIISDEIKPDGMDAVKVLRRMGVKEIVMLSGDSEPVTRDVASRVGIDHAHGGLLPKDKVEIVKEYVSRGKGVVAFAGDGINDAPSIALSDVGIAMGAMGSDLAIETADVVIQTDQPSKIATAVGIARRTNSIVWQNIILVFTVKLLFILLGAFGIASIWEAVFADMGVALAAIFNAIRIQRKRFDV